MIKVAYVTRQDAMNSYGGAETQLTETLDRINSRGEDIRIEFFDMWHDKLEEFGVVHIFNPNSFPQEALKIAALAKKRSVRVSLSPICFDSYAFVRSEKGVVGAALWWSLVRMRRLSPRNKLSQVLDPYRFLEPLLSMSDVILPNSHEESEWLRWLFPSIPEHKFEVIPNGVDLRFREGNPSEFRDRYKVEDFVLFVGRVEKRKNLLRLIRAFVRSRLETKLVVLGEVVDEDYFVLCKREASDSVLFLPPLPHDSTTLAAAYKACKVVALPSYYETPGLVGLEAGLAGANVVVTAVGGSKEYFGELAWYVNPTDERSIEEGIVAAYETPKHTDLSNHIESNYNWDVVAQKTLRAYRTILSR